MRHLSSVKSVIVSVFFALIVSACATNRSVINVKAPVGVQPTSGAVAKIVEVRDTRQFSTDQIDPSQPTLRSPLDVQNPAITSRIIARKRNGFGTALGDFALPANTSVASLVRDAARTALQDKGYMVVDESSPQFADALPLSIDVEQFWAWSLRMVRFDFTATLALKGDGLLARSPTYVNSQITVNSVTGLDYVWGQTIQAGLKDLIEKMKSQIKVPGGSSPVSQVDEPKPSTTNLGF